MLTPDEIDNEFKRRFHAGEAELAISSWYKEQHKLLIDERHRLEKVAARSAPLCEVCGDEMPVRPGRPPSRCEDCR